MVAPSSGSSSLKEYLKRYENNEEEEKKKKKKKKKMKTKPDMNGVLVVDEDPVWQKPVQVEEEDDESQDEEKPQVDEDIEVKRMKRLEQLKSQRPFGAISEDGSGWVPVSDTAKNSDISPPRRRRARNDTPEPESESEHITELNSDMSPPRKRRARNDTPESDPDLSPPRKGRSRESDISPPRRGHNRPHEDLSPPRKKHSPPRKPIKESERPKTGLVSGKDIKEEIAKTKKEDWLRFQKMDPSISGRNAEGVRRDKRTGERLTKDQIKALQKEDEKPKEIKLEWGKGLAQKREAEARLQELELEKAKPFARTRDDPDLDNMMKDRVRWGDPMAHLVKKKQSEVILPDIGDNERMRESGFIVPQQVPNHSWLKRGFEAAPNRYGIRPGRHWDGVDRSNGFEKQMFNRQNEKQATEREAYLWSVADM
ncbi:unnamed protein product [Lactuca saligna]|uniref:BUD13 homolog n=1 Tax=Lactuca saligna TaxID=75948 RepID=A0AA35ZDN2_LACSI|nr:unnamed protein product [Lactuca saligna]